jgi:septin family protein
MFPPYETSCKSPHSHAFCSFAEIVGYLERQYDDILATESRIKRNPRFRDNRVHALLYFITPTGHGFVFAHVGLLSCTDRV